MAYLGNDLQVAFPSYKIIDDISGSFNGVLTSFALQVGGATPVPFPINPQQCLISVNGVVQQPDPTGSSGFNLVGSNIVFASAPTGGHTFFGVILAGADYINVGVNYPSGSASAPSITFDTDLDTGIYNPASNELAITTNSTKRFNINSSGQVEISSAGSNSAPALFFNTDTNTGLYSPGADQVAISTNGTGRLFVDASGNVGVGTANPNNYSGYSTITLDDTNGSEIDFEVNGTLIADIYANTNGINITTRQIGDDIRFATNAAGSVIEKLRITSDGKLGIGTTSPATALHVSGSGTQRIKITGTGSANAILTLDAPSSFGSYIEYGGSASNPLIFYDVNAAAERARIDTSGRLLVGTSTSVFDSKIQVLSTGNDHQALIGGDQLAQLAFARSSDSAGGAGLVADDDVISRIEFFGNDGSTYRRAARIEAAVDGTPGASDMPGRLVFSTTADGASSPTERMRISSNGDVNVPNTFYSRYNAVFTWNSSAGIKAVGDGSTNTGGVGIETACSTTNTRHHISFSNGNGVVGSISTNGSATAYNTSSDYRLKENVVPLTGAADRLNQLQVHRFNFIADPGTTVDGFLAHEAEAVVPECVTGTKDEVDDDGNPVYQGIDQSKLVPLLTAALQEAMERIENLEAEVAALKAQ